MVKKFTHRFNKIFDRFQVTKQKLIRSSGLVFVAKYMADSGLLSLLLQRLRDTRVSGKVRFPIAEIVTRIILHLLDGDKRISRFRNNPNLALFVRMFGNEAPHPSAILAALKSNRLLKKMLDKVILRYALKNVVAYCKSHKIREIVIDTDQSAREIYGHQENVTSGYFAGKPKNTRGFQFRIWCVRDLKILLKADLMPGSTHSQNGVIADLKLIMRTLKKAGITGIFVGDSGFYSTAICDLIEKSGHKFIFAVPQHRTVKRRGKYAKNKRTMLQGQIVVKEGFRPASTKPAHRFREIYIQVLSTDNQLWFDFAADEFTNVLVTNSNLDAEKIYQLYRGHAIIETVIEELKNDFATGIAHSAVFHVNATMTTISALAYNVKNGFIDTHRLYFRKNERVKLSTLQNSWLHIPGAISFCGNRHILRLTINGYEKFTKIQVAA